MTGGDSVEQKTRILLVEDDTQISRYLALELEHEGYVVEVFHNGADALDSFGTETYDLVLLDLMLPGLSGVEVCRRIRKKSNVSIIMVTAKDSVTDKVLGLDLGANDYLTKPFEIEELLARIRVALRRSTSVETTAEEYSIADLSMNLLSKTVKRGEIEIQLTKREFDLLQYLMENKGIVLSRESLLQNVWQWEFAGETNTVDVYIRYLRGKIDRKFDKQLIHTVRGFGYVLKDPDD